MRLRVWPDGTVEPTTWQLVATDATAELQDAGVIGVDSTLSGSSTNAPVQVQFDNLRAGPIGGVAQNQAPVAAFTPTAAGLVLSVSGAASSDADGTVASYAWSFGD
ncbi:MAG: PKD domain-containing protein, partial [Cellulomonas sp.]